MKMEHNSIMSGSAMAVLLGVLGFAFVWFFPIGLLGKIGLAFVFGVIFVAGLTNSQG